jgi:hypothetical protein
LATVGRVIAGDRARWPIARNGEALIRDSLGTQILRNRVRALLRQRLILLSDPVLSVAATDHDAGVQARAQMAFNYDVILVGTANGDARGALLHHKLSVIEAQPQTHAAR